MLASAEASADQRRTNADCKCQEAFETKPNTQSNKKHVFQNKTFFFAAFGS